MRDEIIISEDYILSRHLYGIKLNYYDLRTHKFYNNKVFINNRFYLKDKLLSFNLCLH